MKIADSQSSKRPLTTELSSTYFRHYPELDGLRGVAILLVLSAHAAIPGLQGGFIGVDIFFVLSGFLITSLLLKEQATHGNISLPQFYMRRVLRLIPALVLFLLISIVSSSILLSSQQTFQVITDAALILCYVINWFFAFDLGNQLTFLFSHTWSLAIEEQFYLVWPVVLIGLLRTVKDLRQLLRLTLLLAAISLALRMLYLSQGASASRVYYGSDARAEMLLIGCALAIFHQIRPPGQGARSAVLTCSAWCSLFSLALFSCFSDWRSQHLLSWGFTSISAATACIIHYCIAHQHSYLSFSLRSRALVWLGRVSYSLYLWHYLVYSLMRLNDHSWQIVASIGTLISLTLTALSYYFLELPFLRMKSRFHRREV